MNDIPQAEMLQQTRDRALLDLSKVELGTVKSYNSQTGLAVVAPAVLRGDDSDIPDVAILQFDVGGFRVNGNVTAGAEVLVLFCDYDPSAFLVTGTPSAPEHDRPHGRYPVAIPLTLSVKRQAEVAAMQALADFVIGSVAGAGQIAFSTGQVMLGGSLAVSPVLRKLDLTSLLSALLTWQGAVATAIGGVPGGGAVTAALITATTNFQTAAAAITGSTAATAV